jgi:hypothetical protein
MAAKRSKHDTATLRRSAKAVAAELRRKPNVLYVTIGQKRVRGIRKKQTVIVVYVVKKQEVEHRHRIPKQIPALTKRSASPSAIRTDVVEVANFPLAFGARSGHLLRAFDNDIGVCGLSFVKNGNGYIVTNTHVACDVVRGIYGNPALLDRTQNMFLDVGPVVYWTPMRTDRFVIDDTAVVRADNIVVDHFMVLDTAAPISGFGSIAQAMNATYWYSVNGTVFQCAHPEWVVGGAPVRVDGVVFNYDQFWQLQMTSGAAMRGHSGALLCRTDNGRILACGLVFGGIEPNFIYALPFAAAYKRAFDAI